MMSNGRADPFSEDKLDLTGFAPTPLAKPKPTKEAVRAVSEQNNFPSRAPAKAAKPTPQRRRRTGRNVQLNIKVTPELLERFTKISDERGWVFGETLERALEALANKPE